MHDYVVASPVLVFNRGERNVLANDLKCILLDNLLKLMGKVGILARR